MQPFKEKADKQWEDTLELDPGSDDDEVRRFLAGLGLKLKTHRAVLDNIRRWRQPEMPFDELVARFKRAKNGKEVFAIPRFVLKDVAVYAKACRTESKRKAWKTRQKKSSV